jgi:peptide/nickel transport system permease protein
VSSRTEVEEPPVVVDEAAVGLEGGVVETPAVELARPTRRPALGRFVRNVGAMAALVFLVGIAVATIFARWVAPYDPTYQDLYHQFSPPSWDHLLGTDSLGRDILSRLIYGARVSLRVSLEAVGIALAIAIPLGLVSGYFRGRVDNVMMRINDAGLSFPPLALALAIAGVLGVGVGNVALALAAVLVPTFTRLIRGQALAVREETFVDASRSIGTPTWLVMSRRVLPNVRSPIIVQASIALGAALLAEAGLSYLGLGAQPPTPSWGSMLREAYDTALFSHGWQLIPPGATIAITVIAFNTIGDGLRDALGIARPTRTRPKLRLRGRSGSARRSRHRRGLTTVQRAVVPAPAASDELLAVEGLTVELATPAGVVRIVDDVSLAVPERGMLGLVGESGSGKTVTALSLMRLLPSPPWQITAGSARLAGTDVFGLGFNDMRALRGRDVAMVFQDPMTSLNPAFTVGDQIVEAIRAHEEVSRKEARRRAAELLARVGLPDTERNLGAYPHQLSGGMRQRVMLTIALACRPKLLIADEPTTALDVTIQAQILDLLRSLADEMGLAVIFVTHDLGVVADLCHSVAVMYAGQIVEHGTVAEVFAAPRHPYTAGLLAAAPHAERIGGALPVIPGRVPAPGQLPAGCRFHPRCDYAVAACRGAEPPLERVDGRTTRCLRHAELVLPGAK